MGSGNSIFGKNQQNLNQQLHPDLLAKHPEGLPRKTSRRSSDGKEGKKRSSLHEIFGFANTDARRMSEHGGKGHSNVQEEAASFRSKAATIKMMMKNQNSRQQFSLFLEHEGGQKQMLMEYYLHIDIVRKIKDPEQRRSEFLETVAKYEKLAEGKPTESAESVIFLSTHTWKDMKTMPDDELLKHIERSQDEVALALTPLFEAFIESPEYKKIAQNEQMQEKRRMSGVGL